MTVTAGVVGGHPLHQYGLIRALGETGLRPRVLPSELDDEAIVDLDVLVVSVIGEKERTIVRRARRVCSDLPIVAILPAPGKGEPQLHSELLADGATAAIPETAPHSIIQAAVSAAVNGWALIVVSSRRVRLLGGLFNGILSGSVPTIDPEEVLLLQHLADGRTREGIGEELHIATRTLDRRLEEVYRKLEVSDRTSAVLKALLWGFLTSIDDG
jgi:DNA-binding NarL/FixJ family response regulator